MSKNKYPKSNANEIITNQEAYVSWDSEDPEEVSKAFSIYGQALEESLHRSQANYQRDFRGLTEYAGSRPGLNGRDFDWFRPGQAAPCKPKEIIAFARYAYRRIGLIHNAIDLMGDFSAQGIRLVHPNKSVERFYNDWFSQVQGPKVSERLGHLLFREANVPIRHYTAKINKKRRREMQRSVGAADVRIDADDPVYTRNEIPWRYTFIDPILVEPIGGTLANLTNNKTLLLKVPTKLKNDVSKLRQSNNPDVEEVLKSISPDILRAIDTNGEIILPPDKTNIYYYKKDDWQVWADPMTYSAFEPLNLYQRLQLTDKAALDGAMNKIRVWKIGSLDHKIAPSPAASSTLSDMLGANVGGGTIDIIWGPDIELLETSSDIQSYLGEEKYRPTLMAIYASLGIPPTLTGTFGANGTTNNFIALKTLVERLNYVRSIIVDFWTEQIKIVQKAMGFRKPASVEFDIMYLEDPASMMTLLLNMADRNIVSDEFVQRHIKANPDIETRRIIGENKARENKNMEKVSPYHEVDKQQNLKKIALQTGVSSPSEVGLDLLPKKEGEKSMMDLKESQMKSRKSTPGPEPSTDVGTPGRPKNSKDTAPRKTRQFQPKTKAAAEIWARQAMNEISDILNPVIIEGFAKSDIRSLTKYEYNQLESIKFEILCNLSVGEEINKDSIARASNKPLPEIHKEFDIWVQEAQQSLGKLNIEELRNMRSSYYVYHKYGNI